MDDSLKEIRKEYIEGSNEMEWAEICGQDLFYRYLQQGIDILERKIDEDNLTSIHPQAVVDYLNGVLTAYEKLSYYQKNVNEKEVS